MQLWPHQEYGVRAVLEAFSRGVKAAVLCTPTGGGKTRCVEELVTAWTIAGMRTVVYTNRRLLLDQLSRDFKAAGIGHGVRAAGYTDERDLAVQIASLQTEGSRSVRTAKWELHQAERVVVDEAHLNATGRAEAIVRAHLRAGALVLGTTATPFDLAGLYDELILAGTPSECRACGAILPARTFGPDEPDWKELKLRGDRNLTDPEIRKAMGTKHLFGRVWTWFQKLNPENKPSLLFAPGVEESLWFAEQFTKAGVRAAHIDGQDLWLDGRLYRKSGQGKDEMLAASREGKLPVICNRFILREGINAPWLAHGIFATVFGSLQSYLQSGGRLLRAHPGMEYVTVQDHGGNWWRHGDLNAERDWSLALSEELTAGLRADVMRDRPERQPFLCPVCRLVIERTPVCPGCGYIVGKRKKKSRMVRTSDGQLREMAGDVYRARAVMDDRARAAKLWERYYHRARSPKFDGTFRQAAALFAQENGWRWPPRDLPLMPKDYYTWFLKVSSVPYEQLIPKESKP
jgi:superfamily II DNA or RNA helicase